MDSTTQAGEVRDRSWQQVRKFGLPANPRLPLLDLPVVLRPREEVVGRLLCLHVCAAVAFGFPVGQAVRWVAEAELDSKLLGPERDLLGGRKDETPRFRRQVEGIWALAWVVGLAEVLDFTSDCPDTLVQRLPDLRRGPQALPLVESVSWRQLQEVLEMLDFAYCLHWAVVETARSGGGYPFRSRPFVIEERRRALEWVTTNDDWYELVLDT